MRMRMGNGFWEIGLHCRNGGVGIVVRQRAYKATPKSQGWDMTSFSRFLFYFIVVARCFSLGRFRTASWVTAEKNLTCVGLAITYSL